MDEQLIGALGPIDHASSAINEELAQGISRLGTHDACRNHEIMYSAIVCYWSQLIDQTEFSVNLSSHRADSASNDVAGPRSTVLGISNRVDPTASFAYNLSELTCSLRNARGREQATCLKSTELQSPSSRHEAPVMWLDLVEAPHPISNRDVFTATAPVRSESKFIAIQVCFDEDDRPSHISCSCNYLKDGCAKSILGGLVAFIGDTVTSADLSLTTHDLVSREEREELLLRWKNSKSSYPGQCVHELFERRVESTPDSTALEFDGKTLTYAELNCRSNRLAHLIVRIRPPSSKRRAGDFLVGICIDRSLEMVVALLSVMKAGYAYVPIDPSYPAERVAFLLENAGIDIVLTRKHLLGKLANLCRHVIDLDDDAANPVGAAEEHSVENLPVQRVNCTPDDPVAVLYTSGSTGVPKGVFISHRGLVSRLHWMQSTFPFAADEVAGHIAQLPFVRALWELFIPLTAGIKVVLVDLNTTKDPEKLARFIGKHKITRLVTAPSLAHTLVSSPHDVHCGLQALKHWFIGGETLHYKVVKAIRQALPNVSVCQLYGATEVHSFATYYPIRGQEDESARVPIGQAISNTAIAILDRHKRILPAGIQGEICAFGDGVSGGYLGQPALTAEKFTNHGFTEVWSTPLYRTGDVGYRLPDGNHTFVSRMDHQVKIRGIRVELGEVETALLAHTDVEKAVVVLSEFSPSDSRLVAYVVPRPREGLDARQWRRKYVYLLRRFLEQKLPPYMIPSCFSILDKLPLNAYGKVLRKELPPADVNSIGSNGYCPPTNDREKLLCRIWEEVLGIDGVGIRDSFFDLGGHSLLAAKIKARVNDAFAIELPLRDIFEKPNVAELAQAIDALIAHGPERLCLDRANDGSPAPLTEEMRPWKFLIGSRSALAHFCVRVFGEVDVGALKSSLTYLIARHDALRMVFESTDDGIWLRPGCPVQADFSVIDMRDELSGASASERFERELLREQIRGLLSSAPDITSGCRARWALIRVRSLESVFVGIVDHMVVDAASMAILKRDLKLAYEAYCKGYEPSLPPLPFRYFDYAHWQERYRATASYAAEKQVHKEHLQSVCSNVTPLATCPVGNPKRSYHRAHGIERRTQVDMADFCARAGITENMLYTAAFHLAVYDTFARDDIQLVMSAADRRFPELHDAVGLFICHRYVRSMVATHMSLADFIARTKQSVLASYGAGFSHVEPTEIGCAVPAADFHVTYRNFPGDGQWELFNLDVKPVELIERLESADVHLVGEKTKLMLRVEKEGTAEVANILGSGLLFSDSSFEEFNERFALALRSLSRASDSSITIGELLQREELLLDLA